MSIDKAFIREAERLAKFPHDQRFSILMLANRLAGTKTVVRKNRVKKTAKVKTTTGHQAAGNGSGLAARARARIRESQQAPQEAQP